MLTYLSVCSGIEAVTVAWRPLGWRPAMFAEIDPFCAWVLHSHYGATRPLHMPSPGTAETRKDARRRAVAIRNVIALPMEGATTNFGDFTKIGAADCGAIDLLAGGTPCQSFSIAGRRAGVDDPRGNLTIEFARLAGRIRPLWLVWENVPGVLSIDGGRTFGAFLGMLGELGYGLAYRILDAQFFGVPQRRRRVFVVGCLGSWQCAAAVLFERHSLSGNPPSRRQSRQELAPTLGARTDGGGGLGTDFDLDGGLIASTGQTSHCLNAGGMGRQDFETETLIAHTLSSEGFDASEDGTGRGIPVTPILETGARTGRSSSDPRCGIGIGSAGDPMFTLQSAKQHTVAFNLRGRDEGAVPELSDAASLRSAAGGSSNSYVAFSAKNHGADADEIAPTLRSMGYADSHANGGGQLAVATGLDPFDCSDHNSEAAGLLFQSMAVRRLTPRECERLQGFPDDYTLVEYRGKLAADGPRYRALGNSMAVPVMRWIGERIAVVHALIQPAAGTACEEARK